MRIRAKTDFLHGRTRFEAGRHYEIPDRVGGFFVGNGWADELADDDAAPFETPDLAELKGDAPRPAADGATLEVQDVTHITNTPKAGG